ncbi:peptidoglycan recognition family protein [Streptomyces sp. NPDC006208]|uniref:N-acetylmuramoyl-L-alanine amidase n=1 Tax=Streptomyces sp. NPDC006208 TaxID=3156734 RepID=UPI0033BCF98E
MATPLSADSILKALRDEGATVVEHRNWRTHNRNHMGPWGPVHGVVIHHTVSSGTDSSVELCYNGHASLPGPLCHTVGAKDGRLFMVGHGRANHAGLGDDDVLRAVIDETALPPDDEANTDGNRHFYGIELVNLGDGKDPWPEVQKEAAVRWAAAICRAHGWSEKSVIAHKEWQPGKVDPTFDMAMFRARVAERLAHPASWNPGSTPPPEEDDVPLTKADVSTVFNTDNVIAVPADWSPGNTHWTAASVLIDQGKRLRSLQAELKALTTTNTKLVEAVAALAADVDDLDPTAIVAELKAAIESIDVRLDVA